MSEELEKLEKQIKEKISNADNLEHLNSIRIEVFGKKGLITNHLKLLSGLPENERKIKGKIINDIKKKRSEINSLRKSLLNFNFQKSTGQLEKTSEIKKTRRKIAALITNLNLSKESNDV